MANLEKGIRDMDAEYDKCHAIYMSGENMNWSGEFLAHKLLIIQA